MGLIVLGIIGAACGITYLYTGRSKKSGVFLLVLAIMECTLGAMYLSEPHFNRRKWPTRVADGDTLYVAPKNGSQGYALIAVKDSTGRSSILLRDFVAQHVISAAIK